MLKKFFVHTSLNDNPLQWILDNVDARWCRGGGVQANRLVHSGKQYNFCWANVDARWFKQTGW